MSILFARESQMGAYNGSDYDNTNADYVRGTEILRQFFDRAATYPAWPYKTFNEFWYDIGKVTTPVIKIHILAEGMGLQANITDMSEADTLEAMEMLADAGAGKVPGRFADFNNALTRRATEFSWVDAVSYTATETASEITDLLVETGKGGVAALKAGKYLVPVLTWGGAALAIYMGIRAFTGGITRVGKAAAGATSEMGSAAAKRIGAGK